MTRVSLVAKSKRELPLAYQPEFRIPRAAATLVMTTLTAMVMLMPAFERAVWRQHRQ